MIIVGADLASQSGICFGRPDATPVVEAHRAPVTREDLGAWGGFYWRVFNRLFMRLADRLDAGETILVNYEAPVLIEKRWDEKTGRMVGGNPIVTTRKLQGLGMLFETAAAVFAAAHSITIDMRECHLSSIKKELTGNGRAQKADMVVAARRAGIVLPEGGEALDCADSFGAWLLAVRHHAPEFSPYWDQRLYGGLFRVRT